MYQNVSSSFKCKKYLDTKMGIHVNLNSHPTLKPISKYMKHPSITAILGIPVIKLHFSIFYAMINV